MLVNCVVVKVPMQLKIPPPFFFLFLSLKLWTTKPCDESLKKSCIRIVTVTCKGSNDMQFIIPAKQKQFYSR